MPELVGCYLNCWKDAKSPGFSRRFHHDGIRASKPLPTGWAGNATNRGVTFLRFSCDKDLRFQT
jgi:hypothetical protein